MNPFISSDWRKQASMTAANDLDIEKAFSDQASGFVENKVGDLMKDEYRIGFEIVKKNDSNTRMVGVFAFRVDKDLIFAPVFFINGEIKGPLLYRSANKMFVPADKEWASYLIESIERRDGKSRSKTSLNESAPLVQMQRLSFNPAKGMGKAASSDTCCEGDCTCCCEVKPVTTASDKLRGVYEIQKSLDTKPGQQPKLSNGCSILKMASADDGTIRISLDDVEAGCLSKQAAEAIQNGEATTIKADGLEVYVNKEHAVMLKQAFFTNIPDNSSQWDMMLDAVEKQASSSAGLLKSFLQEPGIGKVASEAILEAASDYKFADALAGLYPNPADLFPSSYEEKQASAEEGGLEIHFSTDELEKSASVSMKYFADGFYIKDTRPAETMSVVYEEAPGNVTAPDTPGVYSLLTSAGEFIDNVIVAPISDIVVGEDDDISYCSSPAICRSSSGDWDREVPDKIAIKDGKITKFNKNVYGIYTGEIKDSDALRNTVESRNVYFVYVNDKFVGPIAVLNTKTVDGVTKAEIVSTRYWAHGMYISKYDTKDIIINKDIDKSEIVNGVFGADAKFVRVSGKFGHDLDSWSKGGHYEFDNIESIGSHNTLNNWLFSKFNATKVKVESSVNQEKKAYIISDAWGNKSERLSKLETLVKMARDMGMSANTAYSMLDYIDAAGSNEFYLQPTEKIASRLTLVDRPIFDDEFDSEFGLPMQPTKKYKLRVQGDQEMSPASAIGDMMNPTTATGLPDLTVATTSPEDLRALADTYHLPHVFEHGMIGTLADTFNAMAMIDKYIPKLEEGVDALGRTKFLIHWCPDDFEKAYGKDDMASLEAEVDTNFEELGALLLKLIRKAEKNKKADIKFENQ